MTSDGPLGDVSIAGESQLRDQSLLTAVTPQMTVYCSVVGLQ